MAQSGTVVAVSCKAEPGLPKTVVDQVYIRENHGVEGDYHAGAYVRHRYLAKKDPTAPNVRQIHLMHSELFAELAEQQIVVQPGQMGENITTAGVDILGLLPGTRLHIGESVLLEITELRTPCSQLNAIDPCLKDAVGITLPDGTMIKKSGTMARVLASGWVRAGDPVRVLPGSQAPEGL